MGYRHPWESGLRKFEPDHMAFFEEDGWWSVPVVSFHSAFEFIDLDLDSVRSQWEGGDLVHFQIPLRWGFRGSPPIPELWILTEEDIPRLENLFGILPHSELENLQLACLKDNHGEPRFAVRESLTGRSRQFLDFGEEYTSFGGFPNLFTPVNYRLEPPVPRDLLGRLLEVKPGTLTVITMVGKRSENSGMETLQISERAFRGINSLVDHIIRGGMHRLETVLESSSLDMGSLATLPLRPNKPQAPKKEKPPAPETNKNSPQKEEDFEEEEDFPEIESPTKTRKKVSAKKRKKSLPVKPASDSEMVTAEKAAVTGLQSSEEWSQVARLKASRGGLQEAVDCYEHAVWVASEELRPELEQDYSSFLSGMTGEVPPEIGIRKRLLQFDGKKKGESTAKYAGRLGGLVKELRSLEPKLSKKARWMLWSQVFSVNPDKVEAERVQESLLSEMSLRGISEKDSFEFIRRHVRGSIQRPQLPENISGLLGKMESYAKDIARPDFRLESLGAIATAWEASGNSDRTLAILGESRKDLESLSKDSGASAWSVFAGCLTRLGQSDSGNMFEQSISRLDQMREGLEKDRVLSDILEQIQYGSLLDSESPLIDKILGVISTQRPLRQCLQLFDCGELLFDLGGGPKVCEKLEELLEIPRVIEDAYYLEHALKALQICQAGRALETERSNRIVTQLLSRERLDESAVRALDLVLEGCDNVTLDSLRPQIETLEKGNAALLESSLIRGLAASGRIDEGLSLLEKRLNSVWDYEDEQEKTRLLCRLVPNVSHFGRPEVGQQMVISVVDRLKESGLGVREQREILNVCSETANHLGSNDLVFSLLTQIVTSLESLVGTQTHGVSHLFEILGLVVDQVIQQGKDERGIQIVQKAVESISARLSDSYGADHPYFVHQARVKCAVAMMSMNEVDQGMALLQESASDITSVRMFDGRDRVDLCVDAVRALSMVPLQDDSRTELLTTLVEAGIGNEPHGTFSDTFRRDMIRQTIREVVQRKSAYRLALIKIRTQEEQIIRSRVLQESLLAS